MAAKRYLDWLQGWAVNALGHCPPLITQALQAQCTQLLTPSPAVHNLPALQLAERLCALSGFAQEFFGSTGAEANEGAIKLARKWGQRHRAGAHEIMLEPVQGEAGVRPASPDFLKALRRLCDERGMLLIFDEIQTGCGRLGHLFAFQQAGVTPDIMTLGKGLGGGVPISAVLAQAHCSVFEHGDQGGTCAGNPLMFAVSLAVVRECRAQGLLVNAARPGCLRFMPRLNSTAEEVQQGLAILGSVLRRTALPTPAAGSHRLPDTRAVQAPQASLAA